MDLIVYAKYDGCNSFVAFDLENGCKAGNIICASTFRKSEQQRAEVGLQRIATENKKINLVFQLRKTESKQIVWTSK